MNETRWSVVESLDGIKTFRLDSWSEFYYFLESETFDTSSSTKNFLWRGQRKSDWYLASTLDRLFEKLGYLDLSTAKLDELAREHLRAFQLAARGRRGLNPPKLSENEWWALGQHFGLATPLLDWTRSPFAAAYFAFEGVSTDQTPCRAIYALNETIVDHKNDEIEDGPGEEGRPPVVELFEPLSDENPRLVNQGGSFTRTPIGVPIEDWISKQFEGSSVTALIKIEIPNEGRLACLRALDRMNISHLSLFPDLTGASRFTNLRLELLQSKEV